jgi:NitT/TauT family transport system substrate-binding protein
MKLSLVGRVTLAAAAAALLASGCGGSGSSTSANPNGLEKAELNVAVLPIPDVAPVYIAIQRGFFKAEGLTVKPQIVQSSINGMEGIQAGTMDVSLMNYITLFASEEKNPGQFKLVADGFQAVPNTFNIMVNGDSAIQSPQDLKGKTISIASLNSISTLAVETTLKANGLDAKRDGVKFVEMKFPDMPAALKTKQIDAAWLGEPFISALQKGGARRVADTMTGPMADFPIAGWGFGAEFAAKNPKTIAAFQRALGKAQQLAATDRKVVEQILPTYTKIDAATASVITLGIFPTTLSDTRLQRVADLMLEFGYLTKRPDAKALIYTPTAK